MIMPQFQELYEEIFKGKKIKKGLFIDLDKFLQNHFRDLMKHKFYREVAFLMDHGMPFNGWIKDRYIVEDMIETCDSNMLSLLDKCDHDVVVTAMNSVLSCDTNEENNSITDYLLKIGYKPNENGIYKIYSGNKSKYSRNLDIIDRYLPSDAKLDFLKNLIANFHFDLIDEFITKYEGRFETAHDDIDSWCLTKKNKNYKRLCEKFNVYYESSSSSSSDYKPRKKSRKYDDDDSPKPKPKEKCVIVSVCYKCAQNHICAACHGDTNKNGSSAFICTKHRDELKYKCPICGNRAGTLGKLCYKCYQKYTTKCYKCHS